MTDIRLPLGDLWNLSRWYQAGPHVVVELPVVHLSLVYGCVRCGARWSVSWRDELDGKGFDDIARHVAGEIEAGRAPDTMGHRRPCTEPERMEDVMERGEQLATWIEAVCEEANGDGCVVDRIELPGIDIRSLSLWVLGREEATQEMEERRARAGMTLNRWRNPVTGENMAIGIAPADSGPRARVMRPAYLDGPARVDA